MARHKRKKITVRNKSFNGFKLPESYTSLIIGAIVVLVIGILFFSFAKGNKNMQTSSIKEEPKMEQQKSQDSETSSTYTIKPGDDLWSISENVYNDGYRWIEIAKANKIENPGLILVGDKLIIQKTEKKEIATQPYKSAQDTSKIMENNAISGAKYIIKEGDNLWDICVRAYGDGYKWVEIAKVNNIQNPDLIFVDNVLNLPR